LTPTTPSFKSCGIWDLFCEHDIAKRRHSQFLHCILASVFQHPFWRSVFWHSNIGKGIHFGDLVTPMPCSGIPMLEKASILAIWQCQKGKSIPNAAFWHSHNGKSILEHQKSALTTASKVKMKT
jgi:hypothetical protein